MGLGAYVFISVNRLSALEFLARAGLVNSNQASGVFLSPVEILSKG